MAAKTDIEWCDATFNPWVGCTKVGPGCDHCYAETLMDTRMGKAKWGPGNPRHRTSKQNWNQPLRWNRLAGEGKFVECSDCGRREFRRWDSSLPPGGLSGCTTPGCLALPESDSPPARPRVFCASLADWLDNEVPTGWLVDLLDLIRRTPDLDWLLLTKRIGNWRGRLEIAAFCLRNDISRNDIMQATLEWIQDWIDGEAPANVWIGATMVNQQEADRDIPKLLDIPAVVRFLSMEPLLGPVDFSGMWVDHPNPAMHQNVLEALDWVIVGGESGPKARPMHPDWVRTLRDQCAATYTPFLFKQWGEHGEWMDRIGKKRTGRLLDGKTHDQFPTSSQGGTP